MRGQIFALFFLFPVMAFCQVSRFNESQVSFILRDNDGGVEKCSHKILPHVPWWSVNCGDRNYTVNTWVQISHHKELALTKVDLMFDVSEGLASSGEKLVQFHSHFSSVYVESLTSLKAVTSDMDVRNGQMSLVMTGQL